VDLAAAAWPEDTSVPLPPWKKQRLQEVAKEADDALTETRRAIWTLTDLLWDADRLLRVLAAERGLQRAGQQSPWD